MQPAIVLLTMQDLLEFKTADSTIMMKVHSVKRFLQIAKAFNEESWQP